MDGTEALDTWTLVMTTYICQVVNSAMTKEHLKHPGEAGGSPCNLCVCAAGLALTWSQTLCSYGHSGFFCQVMCRMEKSQGRGCLSQNRPHEEWTKKDSVSFPSITLFFATCADQTHFWELWILPWAFAMASWSCPSGLSLVIRPLACLIVLSRLSEKTPTAPWPKS
jgi:hypothetical protein